MMTRTFSPQSRLTANHINQMVITSGYFLSLSGLASPSAALARQCKWVEMNAPAEVASAIGSAPVATQMIVDDASADAGAAINQFISFAIGDHQYGVDIMAVREIKGWSQITHLPRQPDYMRGVLNLRGVMVPIIDLRCRFGQGMTAATPLHVVIVVQIGSRHIGILADRVLDIVATNASQIQPVPRVDDLSRSDFLSGLVTIDSGMIALIDLYRLLAISLEEGADLGAGAPRAA
jgi:purine-binding chemotaxis protein CheW